MPDTKITALTAIGANPIIPATFPIPMVDLTDTSMAASGTTKKVTVNQILGSGGTATLASATITGDLTVRTTGLTTTANAVGINTASPTANTLTIGASRYILCSDSQSKFGDNGIINGAAADANTQIQYFGGKALFFNEGASTRMTLNSTGLGVGVASPDFKFVVNGTQAVPSTSGSSATDGSLRIGAPGTGLVIDTGVTAASAVYGWIQARARTDYSSNFNLVLNPNGGNVGIGVTPSAWGSGFRYVQAGPGSALGTNGSVDRTDVAANWYYNAGDKYINATGKASIFQQSGGAFFWLNTNTASGGAGSACSLTTAMTLDASGNLLVGTTSTAGNAGGLKLSNVAGNLGQITFSNNSGSADYVARFNWGSTPTLVGNITVSSGGTAFNTTSDYRLKESVQPLLGGLARVNALKPSVYKWKTDGSNGEGFLAHELAEMVPAAVTGDKDAVNEDGSIKPQGVDLSKVVPILVAAIKELTAEVNALKNA